MSSAAGAPGDLDAVRRLLSDRTGMEIPDDRLGELGRVVGAHARAAGVAVERYTARLTAAPGIAEVERLAAALSVHETFFFRGRAQLERIVERVLDELGAARPGRPIRVLSAGASNGAEAYTIAILLRERRREIAPLVHITGIDISPAAVVAARRGRYHPWALRQTPPDVMTRWFQRRGPHYELDPVIRAMASFEVRNLTTPDQGFWAKDSFDVIVCRNVLMYLGAGPAQGVFSRLEQALSPRGYLFVGPDDLLRGYSSTLALHREEGLSFYHGAPGPRPAPAPASAPQRPPSPLPPSGAPARPIPAAAPAPALVSIAEVVALVERGDLAVAERICVEAQRAGHHDAVWSYLRALCGERAGDLAGARRHATAAAFLDPTFAMPCVHLGLLAQRARDHRGARRELTRAVALLAVEDQARIDLFGGGLSREELIRFCRRGIAAIGEGP